MPHSLIPDDSIPIPPRFWWLKRIMIATALLLVFLIALRLWWGWVADRRLQAEIDRIVAAGEPIFPEDFNPKERIPDEENAAIQLDKAAKLLTLTKQEESLLETIDRDSETIEQSTAELRRLFDEHDGVWPLVQQASNLQRVDWRALLADTQADSASAVFQVFGHQRRLAMALRVKATLGIISRDYRSTIAVLRDLVAQSRAMASAPSVIGQMIADRSYHDALKAIRRCIQDLTGELGVGTKDSKAEEQIIADLRALLDDLQDEGALRLGLKQAVCSERIGMIDSLKSPQGRRRPATLWPQSFRQLPSWSVRFTIDALTRPCWDLDMIRVIRHAERRAECATEQSWGEFRVCLPELPKPSSAVDYILHPVTAYGLEGSNEFGFRFSTLAELRLTSTLLALRLFAHEHGRIPATLADITPDLLASVPNDPFGRHGDVLHLGHRNNRTVVYCVGFDGVDGGGDIERPRDASPNKYANDRGYYLDGMD